MNGFLLNDFNSDSVRPELVEGLRMSFSAESKSDTRNTLSYLNRTLNLERFRPKTVLGLSEASRRVVPEHFLHDVISQRFPRQHLVGGLGKAGLGVGVIG